MAATNGDDVIPDDVTDGPPAEQPAIVRAFETLQRLFGAMAGDSATIRREVSKWYASIAAHARTVRAEIVADVLVRAVGASLLAGARHIAEQIEEAAREQNENTNTGGN